MLCSRNERRNNVINISCTNHQHYGYITVATSPIGTPSGVARVVLKRKISTEYGWISVYTKEVSSVADLTFTFDDYLCRNKYTYNYKVEYRNSVGNIMDSTTVNVNSFFDVLVICDSQETWYTPLNCAAINFNTVRPYVINTPLFAKKPSYYSPSEQNYEEGNCTGIFLKMTGPEDKIVFETDHNWKYRKDFKNFITLGNAKVIKSVSGEMWLVGIKTDTISDASLFQDAEIDGARQLEFGWIEIGDVDSEEDLYENGIINVPSTYWSGV